MMTMEAKASSRKFEKFSVEMSSDAVQMVDELKDKLDKRSRAEVFRTAVLLLTMVLAEAEKGHALAFVKEESNGEQRILRAVHLML